MRAYTLHALAGAVTTSFAAKAAELAAGVDWSSLWLLLTPLVSVAGVESVRWLYRRRAERHLREAHRLRQLAERAALPEDRARLLADAALEERLATGSNDAARELRK